MVKIVSSVNGNVVVQNIDGIFTSFVGGSSLGSLRKGRGDICTFPLQLLGAAGAYLNNDIRYSIADIGCGPWIALPHAIGQLHMRLFCCVTLSRR